MSDKENNQKANTEKNLITKTLLPDPTSFDKEFPQ